MTTDHAGMTAGTRITNGLTAQGYQPYTRTDGGGSCIVLRVPGTPDELWICGEGAGQEATVNYAPAAHEALTLRLAPDGDDAAPGARELEYCDTGDLTIDTADVIRAARHHINNPRLWEVQEQVCAGVAVTTKFDGAKLGARAEWQAAAHYTARRPLYLQPCPQCRASHTIALVSVDAGAEHIIDSEGLVTPPQD
ncbi:hypothetical protein [Streptomyces sp. NPDC018045]|uniref:hypothetical protein n=1 Tax=Streptomyces sp. NPDC018045 TaxID=3365037 RepID=UPI00379E7464